MSREIKFRAWDKKSKCIKDLIGFKDCRKAIQVIYLDEDGDETFVAVNKEQLELTQYTGLKDKNGKEIFEGDIVNKIGIVSEEVFELKKDYIEINTPQLGNVLIFTDILYDRKTGYKELLVKENTNGILSETQNYEVIGNIYKNPELLEGEE